MKKFGFTLSETLITLAILGIVAAIGIPQVVTMAQKHKSEAIKSKAVYQMELGVQNLISDANNTPGNFSFINKLMLIDNWQSKLLRYIDASEVTDNQTAWNFIFGSPAFADNRLEHVVERDPNIVPKDPSIPNNNNSTNIYPFAETLDPDTARERLRPDDGTTSGLNTETPADATSAKGDSYQRRGDTTESTNSSAAAINTTSTYRINNLGAEIKFSDINSAKSSNADDIAFKVIIDTNGVKKPDKEGIDQFTYSMRNSGRMIYIGDKN